MCVALVTHPDIMFVVTFLSQFMQNPRYPHWKAVKQVFHYLKGTIDFELTIGSNYTGILGYTDANG